MSQIKKMLWPSAIALGFLVFLGAIGQGSIVKTAFADQGDICTILSTANVVDGEFQMQEDETHLFVAIVENEGFDDELDLFDSAVDLDDEIGDSDITSRAEEDGDVWEYVDDEIDTDFLNEVGIIQAGDDVDDLNDQLDDEFSDDDDDDTSWTTDLSDVDGEQPDVSIGDNVCGDDDDTIHDDLSDAILAAIAECLDRSVCSDFDWTDDNDNDVAVQEAGLTLREVADAWADIIIDNPDYLDESCYDDFHDDAEIFLIEEGTSEDEAADATNQFCDFVGSDFCEEDEILCLDDAELGVDGWVIVDVTCDEAGTFEVSFSIIGESEDSEAVTVNCSGEVDEGLITATPNKVEIIPAMGSVSFSLIVVELLDEDGNPVDGPVSVDFDTDRCVFLDEDGLDEEGYLEVANFFEEYDPNEPQTAEDLTDAIEGVDSDDDSDDVSNEVDSFILSEDTDDFDEGDNLAVVILDCSDEDTTPGIANVCFQSDAGGEDVDGCVKVTVVGPPAKVTAAAAPASVICGEKATISVEVLDAANQPVSDHTRVEAVTNLGGVLAGTGAVAGQAGLVTPVSSTVAETFNGKATLYLLTSDAHTGPYEVVVASGGQGSVNTGLGGVFSTAPQVTQVTVACTQPVVAAPSAPAPTVTAPRTGTGTTISPPNTGDAGLADQSAGSSFALILVAGVVAFSVAGLATLKISRR